MLPSKILFEMCMVQVKETQLIEYQIALKNNLGVHTENRKKYNSVLIELSLQHRVQG